jgi:hypothetical protein
MIDFQTLNGKYKEIDEQTREEIGTNRKNIIRNGEKKSGVAFDDNIPNVGPEIFILRMKGARSLTFTIWGTQIRGIWIHWVGKGSEPHFRDAEQCEGCKKNKEKRWKGFLHCYCSEMRQEVFLELTPASARSLRDQLAERATLRGSVIQVKRTTADNGRLYISTLTPRIAEGLPPEKDPRPSIMRLWGVDDATADAWLKEELGTGDDATFK